MERNKNTQALILGISIILGLSSLGYLLGNAALRFKAYERSVTVKGLSEREFPADIVIWPIQFTAADNQLEGIYAQVERNTNEIQAFLRKAGIKENEMTVSAPSITDKLAQRFGGDQKVEFRYSAIQTVTVYSGEVQQVRSLMKQLNELGKRGIVFTEGDYQNREEYLFTRLNDVKPEMIQEATTKAREVAQKFAEDSNSLLGKIKRASQGSFSISPRDKNNPHIKKIRVVSTIEYYLTD
ncbi:SIMPL domain-containing protein [Methylomarinum vadi]|uniref:SIMPL domain-containing protein n=1 Tax=Methylomarinum vadi TaxID=438855 RepID=UPI0004DFCC02|nr:SIMPL domain-containing protein [Methylomarinum vadi]